VQGPARLSDSATGDRGFVQGAGAVPAEERVAVFDNDGTLWCEKPIPAAFIRQLSP
jgi:hypothetical protein